VLATLVLCQLVAAPSKESHVSLLLQYRFLGVEQRGGGGQVVIIHVISERLQVGLLLLQLLLDLEELLLLALLDSPVLAGTLSALEGVSVTLVQNMSALQTFRDARQSISPMRPYVADCVSGVGFVVLVA
jgi:hypothetical protein